MIVYNCIRCLRFLSYTYVYDKSTDFLCSLKVKGYSDLMDEKVHDSLTAVNSIKRKIIPRNPFRHHLYISKLDENKQINAFLKRRI